MIHWTVNVHVRVALYNANNGVVYSVYLYGGAYRLFSDFVQVFVNLVTNNNHFTALLNVDVVNVATVNNFGLVNFYVVGVKPLNTVRTRLLAADGVLWGSHSAKKHGRYHINFGNFALYDLDVF